MSPDRARDQPSFEERGRVLLRLARAALESELVAPGALTALRGLDAPWLLRPGASFVTLRRGGRLRGCLGTLEASRPLVEDVAANAVAAASRDPRFSPVDAAELGGLRLEVSVLGPQELLETPDETPDETAAAAALRPGIDGVVLRWRRHRATFLPQVWEQLPTPSLLLAQLKRKAGLREDFWHPEIELRRYQVENWTEDRAEDRAESGP